MDSYTYTHKISNEYQPTVRTRLVGIVLPFQYKPEYNSGEERRESIDFTLYGTKPESIRERISQRSDNTRTNDGYKLGDTANLTVLTDEATKQMGNSPKKEQDAACTK